MTAPDLTSKTELVATGKKDYLKGLLALVDQAFVSLNNFVTFILVAKFCPDRSDIDLYFLAWSIFNVLRVIQERGLAAPYFVFSHQEERDGRSFLGSSLVHQFCFGVLAAILFAVLASLFSLWQSPLGMAQCCLVLSVSAPFILLRDHLRAVSCAQFRYGMAVFLSAAAMVIQVSLIIGLFFADRLNVFAVFIVMGIASFLPCAFWFWLRPFPFVVLRQRVRADWGTTFQFSKWLVMARFFPTAAMGLLPWFVVWAIDENAAGTLGGCITLANVSNMFVFGANYFFLPKAVRALNQKGAPAMVRVLLQTAFVFGAVLLLLCGIYWFAGDLVLRLAFGESFRGYAGLATVIGLSYWIVSFSTIAGNGMTALNRPQGLFWGELSFGIVALVSGTLLPHYYGLHGAAIAMCLASAAATIVETYGLIRYLTILKLDPHTSNSTDLA